MIMVRTLKRDIARYNEKEDLVGYRDNIMVLNGY